MKRVVEDCTYNVINENTQLTICGRTFMIGIEVLGNIIFETYVRHSFWLNS